MCSTRSGERKRKSKRKPAKKVYLTIVYLKAIPYVSKVKPINKIHAQSCNRNAITLKKQSTRTMSTLFWCLSLYKAKLF